MSSSDRSPAAARSALETACAALAEAIETPELIGEKDLQNLLASVVRAYAAKASAGLRRPFPAGDQSVTTDDVMLLSTDMLHALNVQLFELSMWQAMTGNASSPAHRLDESD